MAAFSFCFSALTCSCLHGISPHLAMWCPTGRACASAGLSRGDSSLGPFPHVEVGHRTSVRCPPVPEPTVLSSGPVLAFSAVVVFQAPLASSELHFPQIGRIMARNSGRQSLLDSAFPLFITHQPPPLWFSLFLSLSLPFPPSTPLPPPHLHCSLPCPAEEQGLIWRVHNNSCNSPALTGPPQARPGPRVQCQTHMCLPVRSEILILQRDSAVPSHDHILVPNPLFYFSPACYHQTQPPYHTLVPTFQQDCMPGQ